MLAYCGNGSRGFAVHVRFAELINTAQIPIQDTIKIEQEPRA